MISPNGEREEGLRVPNYRFDWQVGYELAEPLDLPKGARLETLGRYDNSAANKFNPDPSARVKFGLQSNDEMRVAFMGVLVDAKADPRRIFVRRGRGVAAGAVSALHVSPQRRRDAENSFERNSPRPRVSAVRHRNQSAAAKNARHAHPMRNPTPPSA